MESNKLVVSVLIEQDQVFTGEFTTNQQLHVIVQRVLAEFHLNPADQRILRRADGTELNDLHRTIAESGIGNNEMLHLFVSAPQKRRKEGFA